VAKIIFYSSLFIMKQSIVLSMIVASLLLVGCGQQAAPADTAPVAPVEDTAPAVEPTPTQEPATWTVAAAATKQANLETSVVKWNAKKVGGEHYGTVKLQNGSVDFDVNNKVVGGMFTIDMNTITVDDLQGEQGAGLLKHLQGDDFFSVATHPTAALKISSVKELSPTSLEISADLTIKGITNPVVFVATTDGTSFTAPIVIDRTLWDIKFRSLKFFSDIADKAIEDSITFDVTMNLQ
jgi:polyisoprenoid-binding protein YceI